MKHAQRSTVVSGWVTTLSVVLVAGGYGQCAGGGCTLSRCVGTIGLPAEPVLTLNSNPEAMVLGDFDGNGLVDMAIAAVTSKGFARVMLATGNGGYVIGDYAVADFATCITTADFNGDMAPDLALAYCPGSGLSTQSHVSVLLNNGDGTFAAAVSSSLPIYTAHLVGSDLDGDKRADLVVAHNEGTTIYFGKGDGTFGAQVALGGDGGTKSLAVADLDANGAQDIIVCNNNAYSVAVYLNQGNGTFGTAHSYPTSTDPRRMAVGDWDGNGTVDVAIVNGSFSPLSLFFNPGDGTLSPRIEIDGGPHGFDIIAGDITGDGRPDLVTSHHYPFEVNVMVNKGGGQFSPPIAYPNTSTSAMGIGDFNGDFRPDVVLAHNYQQDISFMFNRGNGTFSARTTLDVDTNAEAAIAADMDNNGTSDILIENQNSLSVSVLLNQGNAEFAPPIDVYFGRSMYAVDALDIDGDGYRDVVGLNGYSVVSVALNQRNGTFGVPIEYPQDPAHSYLVAGGDFNGDGKQDVVIDVYPIYVGVFCSTGSGNLAQREDFEITEKGYQIKSLVTGDFNGDGLSDIAVGTEYGKVRVLLSQSNGTFGTPPGNYPIGGSSISNLLANDVDADGLLDLVAADSNGSAFQVLHNIGNGIFTQTATVTTPQSPRGLAAADVDYDGIKDVIVAYGVEYHFPSRLAVFRGLGGDSFTYAASYETSPSIYRGIAAADFDGDGVVDFATVGAEQAKLDILLNRCLPR